MNSRLFPVIGTNSDDNAGKEELLHIESDHVSVTQKGSYNSTAFEID